MIRVGIGVLLFAFYSFPGLAQSSLVATELTARIPDRPQNARTGAEFLRATSRTGPGLRERQIAREILSGNIPSYLRHLKPVNLYQRLRNGQDVYGTVFVMPDYLAIGGDQDAVRIPMNLHTAARVAQTLGFALPTRKLVNKIYQQSSVILKPHPLKPGGDMTSNEYYYSHNRQIEEQLASVVPGELVSGHKKDVVISSRLLRKPHAIAIYGWHMAPGNPLQPLSTVHSAEYADYSHGVRLISDKIVVNGVWYSLYDVLQHPFLNELVSDEGRIPRAESVLAGRV